jgi:hypothetical protein
MSLSVGVLLLILTLGSHVVRAEQEGESSPFFPSEEEKDLPFFDRRSWVSTTYVDYYAPQDEIYRDIRMSAVHFGAEGYLRKNLGIVAESYLLSARGNIMHDKPVRLESDSLGVGGALGLKWHFLRGRRWSTFVKGTGGVLFTNKAFPTGGTVYNFMLRGGFGLTFRLRRQLHLLAGTSRLHVSNGQGLTRNNPAYDGEGGYVGLAYRFGRWGLFN